MHFLNLVFTFALAALPATQAAPAPATVELAERDAIAILFVDNGYKGKSWAVTDLSCQNVPSWLNDLTSSFELINTQGCNFFTNYGCQGYSFYSTGNKKSLESPFNDSISSVHCGPSDLGGNDAYKRDDSA